MNRSLSLLTLTAALLAPAFAHADTFTITTAANATPGTTPFTISFSLPATPSGVTVNGGGFPSFNVPVSVVRNGVLDTTDILTFYTAAAGGGLSDNDSAFGPFGPQLFSGTLANPTFLLGTFNLSNENLGTTASPAPGATDYVLTISGGNAVTTTPEPSSLALLGTGVLGLAGVARRRFIK